MSERAAKDLETLLRELRSGSEDIAIIRLRLRVIGVHNDAVESAALLAMGKAVDQGIGGEDAKAIGDEIRGLQWQS